MSRFIDAHDFWARLPINTENITLADITEALGGTPTIKAEPKWTPVSERLPEEPFGCLVTVVDYNPFTGDSFPNLLPFFVGCDDGRWYDYDGEEIPYTVLAWIPLPNPYEGEWDD